MKGLDVLCFFIGLAVVYLGMIVLLLWGFK